MPIQDGKFNFHDKFKYQIFFLNGSINVNMDLLIKIKTCTNGSIIAHNCKNELLFK
jgi:hypothetical protein